MTRRLILAALFACAAFVYAQPANAQPATEAEYRAARQLIEQERPEAAVAAYRALAERSNEARAWLGLAVATNLAGDPTTAANYVERALSLTSDAWLNRNRATAEGLATQFWPLVGRLLLTCEVQGAEVFVDGLSIGRTPLPTTGVVVASGERRVEVRSAAHEPFSMSLRVAPSDYAVTPEIQQTRRAVTLVAQAVRQIGRITVTSNVEGAAVFVDEEFRVSLPMTEPLVVEPGQRRISLRAAGYEERFAIVEVPGGPENAPPAPIEVDVALEASTVAARGGSSGGVSPAVKWSIVGAGGLLIAGAGVTSGLWASTHTDLDQYCTNGACVNTADSRDARDRFRVLRLTSIVVGGVGVGALVTGLVLRTRRDPPSTTVDVACDGLGCAAVLEGRF